MCEKVVDTIPLFPEISAELIRLLQGLSQDDWHKETCLPGRTVKDIVSHLLDGALRRLSIQRDGHTEIENDISSFEDLVVFIQKMNRDWVDVSKRLSPEILIALLEIAERWFYEFTKTLNPHGKAIFAVAWAGEIESQNWFDIAREYTERWHHQMQIRLVVDKPGIDTRRLFFPVIDTFMLGLPYAYRNSIVSGSVKIEVTGQAHGVWYLKHKDGLWMLGDDLHGDPEATIKLSGDIAWQLLTDSISRQEAEMFIEISGNKLLVELFLNMKAVMR